MASYSAASSKHATLTPSTVDTVTLTNQAATVTIANRATAPLTSVIYVTIGGADPSVGDDETIAIHAGQAYETRAASSTVVKLISATADPYSVMVEG